MGIKTKLSDKAKVYDKIRDHILNAERELGQPPQLLAPYMPNVKDFDSVRAFYRMLKESAVKNSEWYSREKEISEVRFIFEMAGENMHGTA